MHEKIQEPSHLMIITVVLLGFMKQDLTDPIRRNLANIPPRALVQEAVHFAIELV
jgi:hypothetical protein